MQETSQSGGDKMVYYNSVERDTLLKIKSFSKAFLNNKVILTYGETDMNNHIYNIEQYFRIILAEINYALSIAELYKKKGYLE